MRTTKDTAQFKKDYKRVARGQYRATLDEDLLAVVVPLAMDQPLPARNRDHALAGEYVGHRECHVKPDLLLIYMKPDDNTLVFVRLGSHSELF
jgi:mRNA interferase YafQ